MADDIIPKLKCAKCGGKKVGLIYLPDASPNAYGKAQGQLTGQGHSKADT
ncbi:hypothetical protein NKJ59_04730 [Mesorhizobium australicum]